MRSSQAVLRIATAATILVAATACSSSSTGPKYTPFTAANDTTVATLATTAVSAVTLGLTDEALASSLGTVPGFDQISSGQHTAIVQHGSFDVKAIQRTVFTELAKHFGNGLRVSAQDAGDCPAVSGNQGDEDDDGIPDSAVYTFTSACNSTTDGQTVTAGGSIVIMDTNPDGPIGYDIVFNALSFSDVSSEGTLSFTENGSRSLTGNTSAVTLADAWILGFQETVSGQTEKVNFTDSLQATFTATTPGSIDFSSGNVPAGQIDIAGLFAISATDPADNVSGSFNLVFSTPSVLQYDPTCTNDNNDNGLVGGELVVAASSDANSAKVDLTFNACGTAPTISFVSGG